jgi:HNH endonuclease
MDKALEDLVWRRAGGACEYCLTPQAIEELSAEIDHVIAEMHGGKTISSNLALSCLWCNRHKGSNLSGIDPMTGRHAPLFHPRKHSWDYHFKWNGARILGRTPIGRTTVRVLQINAPLRVMLREELIVAGMLNLGGKPRR